MKTKREDVKILIKTDFASAVKDLFNHFSCQLSDGYWENSGGQWAEYKDKYYPGIWNCFDFECNKDGNFVIILKAEPTWDEAEDDCEKFHEMKKSDIVAYLVEAILYSIEEHPGAFDFRYSDRELDILTSCIKDWEVLPDPLPKLSHADLVKIIGYDFEYTK